MASAKKMSPFDEALAAASKHRSCKVRDFLTRLSAEDRLDVDRVLNEKDERGRYAYSAALISRVCQSTWGTYMAEMTVRRHRVGECSCVQ